MPENKENEQVISANVESILDSVVPTYSVVVSHRQKLFPVLHNTFLPLAQYKMEAGGGKGVWAMRD